MDIHKNARRTLRSREQLALFVLAGNSLCAAPGSFFLRSPNIFAPSSLAPVENI